MKITKSFAYMIFTIISLVMLTMSFSVIFFSPLLFLVNTCITIILILSLFIILKNYSSYIFNISNSIQTLLDTKSLEIIEIVPIALAITSNERQNRILSYNSTFKEKFLDGEDYFYGTIQDLINTQINALASNENEIQITFKRKCFKVYSKKIDEFVIFYFWDNTEYKTLKRRHIDGKPCIGIAAFDNKEELFQLVDEEQSLQLLVSVENILNRWMNESNGILKKLADGKYLLVFERQYLKKFINKKFDVINKIHNVKTDPHKFATISCGISDGAKTLEEAKICAENALNMALGRGGDQVAVKSEKGYEFFGGSSPGLEKRSKVRTRVVAMALLEKIQSCNSVFIMGHKFSDFDSVGASVGLWSVCTKFNKKAAYVVVNREQSMAKSILDLVDKNVGYKAIISPQEATTKITDNSFLIVVDTHSEKFLESNTFYKLFKHIAVIDHHRMTVDKITGADIFFHEPFASSACEMVTELVQYMGDKHLKKWEAESLLAGIMLDTKSFSLKSGIRTFEAGAYLKRKGADSSEVKKMFADSIESYKIKCKIIESAEIFENCAIAMYREESDNARLLCAQAADNLLNIKNVRASFVLFKNKGGTGISSRSLGDVNVQLLMESFGGGGHQTMAAGYISNIEPEDVKQKLMDLISKSLSNNITKNGE